MGRLLLRLAVLLVALVALGSVTWADPITNVNVTGTVWRINPNFAPAPYSDPISGLLGGFTAEKIDFTAFGGATLGNFLSSGGAVLDGALAASPALGQAMSDPGAGNFTTIIKLTGVAFFREGTQYTLTHDDGAVMSVGNLGWVIDSPAPTVAIPSYWTPGQDIWAPFTIYYSGTNGNPEVLRLEGAVPDGGMTLLLLGGALLGIESLRRKFRC